MTVRNFVEKTRMLGGWTPAMLLIPASHIFGLLLSAATMISAVIVVSYHREYTHAFLPSAVLLIIAITALVTPNLRPSRSAGAKSRSVVNRNWATPEAAIFCRKTRSVRANQPRL
jgi:hypothetical protein